MKEIFTMWRETKMVVLVALSAGLYAALLIPFKGFVLIPGITEIRPASALPVVLGLLFGPAGAWGAAIGNLIGDFFGSLGVGSSFGFVGNFLFAYVPYKIWANLKTGKGDKELNLASAGKVLNFVIGGILGACSCGLFIAWGLEILGMLPFAALGSIITLNNAIPGVVLGIPLFMVLAPRIKKWDLYWMDIMPEEDLPKGGKIAHMGVIIMTISIVVGLGLGLIVALGAGQALFGAGFAVGNVGAMGVKAVAGLGILGMFIGGVMQR